MTKEVTVKVNNKNINHLRSHNLNVKYGGVYQIDVKFLPRYSKYRILAKCESCGKEQELSLQKYHQNWERSNSYNCKACNNITYKKSMMLKYGYDNPANVPGSVEKRKKTCLEKYGSELVISSEYSKNKTKETLNIRFGGHQSKVPEIMAKIVSSGKKTKIEKGLVVPDGELSEWELYRRKVRSITNRNKKELFDNWNGFDYYDNEYIKDNFQYEHVDVRYPTIDHKISIINGFVNNLSPDEIGKLENLCITKRSINSSKSFLNDDDFINQKNQS